MGYDESYDSVPDLFGTAPDPMLPQWQEQLDRSRPVLDVGGGQGRNALYLAQQGLTVELLDPSAVALRHARAAAETAGVDRITTHLGGFRSFDGARDAFGGALLFGVIQVLPRPDIEALIARLRLWLTPSGLLFITAFTVDDAGCAKRRSSPDWTELSRNSFENEEGTVRTFLEPGELSQLFKTWETRHYREARGPVHRHGDGAPEQHAMVEAVFEAP